MLPFLCCCFLRASGGVSLSLLQKTLTQGFSPRKRRCFLFPLTAFAFKAVFSAQAEVFLTPFHCGLFGKSFLRASGGVSAPTANFTALSTFSPRKRRCFLGSPVYHFADSVFSAQAEVFPLVKSPSLSGLSFLRASGGVSSFLRSHRG